MRFEKFLKTYEIGKSYGYEGTYVGECVSLVKNYIKDVLEAKPQSIGDAKEYWLKRDCDYIQKLFIPIKNTPEFVPKKGDLFVRTTGKWGHIGIVLSGNKDEFVAYEQNAGGSRKVDKVLHTNWTAINFLRPRNQKNIKPIDHKPPKIEKGKVYELTANRGIHKGYGMSSGYKTVAELPRKAKKHCTKTKGNAYFKEGTRARIKETKILSNGNMWAKCNSGYLCIWTKKNDKLYIKKS